MRLRSFSYHYLLVSASLLVSAQAIAEMPTYSRLQLHALRHSIDGIPGTNQGVFLGATAQLSPEFFLAGEYQQAEVADDLDLTAYDLAFGIPAIIEAIGHTSGALLLGYHRSELEHSSGITSDDDTQSGAYLGFTLRNRTYEKVEFSIDLKYVDWAVEGSSFAKEFGISYFMYEGLALQMNYETVGVETNTSAGLAYYF